MAKWIRFEQGGKTGFGTLEGDTIAVHAGDLFASPKPSGERLKLSEVRLLTPCDPSKMVCLWNNFHQLAAKNEFKEPKEPLWFLKAPNAYWPANRPIERPATYAGKIIYEGELGVVIGKKCFNISEAEAGEYIFGYTCVNDLSLRKRSTAASMSPAVSPSAALQSIMPASVRSRSSLTIWAVTLAM